MMYGGCIPRHRPPPPPANVVIPLSNGREKVPGKSNYLTRKAGGFLSFDLFLRKKNS